MFSISKVIATVIEDDSGLTSQVPILLTDHGEISSLTDYLLYAQLQGKSRSWINKTVYAVQLLLRYMAANASALHDRPQEVFQLFIKRLYTGTIGEDGLDPLGLYWFPNSDRTNKQTINALSNLTDWLSDRYQLAPLNPFMPGDTHSQRLQHAAWYRKNSYDFLGHIKGKDLNCPGQKRMFQGENLLHSAADDDSVAFNEKLFPNFFHLGLGGTLDPRSAMRNKLIGLLLHGGGLRISEALHLWVSDVFESPDDPESALVRIYHPEEGKAPHGWKGLNGSSHRAAYLREKFAISPRNKLQNTQWVGWKCRLMDHRDNYIQVHWFPNFYGRLFMQLWREYIRYLAYIDRQHPYAFIVFNKTRLGCPYTLPAFNEAYKDALSRIALEPNKSLGLSPHAHRHAYGRRLESSGLSPLVIKKCMHHSALASQLRYTTPSLIEVSKRLNEAMVQLETTEASPASTTWKELLKTGFEGVDPDGYFSGPAPSLHWEEKHNEEIYN